jgi:hypothetical protein
VKNEVHKCFKAQHLEHKAAKQALLDECALSKSSHAAVVAHKEVLEAQLISKHEEAERSAEDHDTHVRGLREQHERALSSLSEENEASLNQIHADHSMHRSALEETLMSVNEEKLTLESRNVNLVAELSQSELKVAQLTAQVAQLTADLASAAVAEWETLRAAAVAVAGPAPAPRQMPLEEHASPSRRGVGTGWSVATSPACSTKSQTNVQRPILL